MKRQSLRAATALLLALGASSMAAAKDDFAGAPPAAAAQVVPASDSTECAQCGNCKAARAKGDCAARLWEWLTYQPLTNYKCCKRPHNPFPEPNGYWYFPCVDSCGQCPVGGYAAKSCGCQP